MNIASYFGRAILSVFFCSTALVSFASAKWITANHDSVNNPNTWIMFEKNVDIDAVLESIFLEIGADTKYWLWVNDSLVVFEGGLKRGPAPGSSYFDPVDMSGKLRVGKNNIRMLLWHFGKDGFSHLDSGKAGVIVRCPQIESLNSDSSWKSMRVAAP